MDPSVHCYMVLNFMKPCASLSIIVLGCDFINSKLQTCTCEVKTYTFQSDVYLFNSVDKWEPKYCIPRAEN